MGKCGRYRQGIVIYYLARTGFGGTMGCYIQDWAPELRSLIRLIRYEEDIPTAQAVPHGTYIFSDLERLTESDTDLAVELWEQLSQAGPQVRLLNHPGRAMRRYDLLHALFQNGANKFDVHRLSRDVVPRQFPVFIHSKHGHEGSASELLHNQGQIQSAADDILHRFGTLQSFLLEEYCDTADGDGIFRKYSAFCIGDKIIPRHLLFSRNWIVKDFDLMDETKSREIQDYLEQNPHAQQVQAVFRLANIDYGRIDYAFADGQMQVWEINTNPIVLSPYDLPIWTPVEVRFAEYFMKLANPVFESLNLEDTTGDSIPVRLSHSLSVCAKPPGQEEP